MLKKGFLIVISMFFIISLFSVKDADYTVKNFQIEDIPNDDGSGLLLKWTPLPKDKHIIEYRVYRGVSKDSLFYLGKMDVDPLAGVVSKEMYFYDKDFREFVNIYSPAKLKREKGQKANSPIYQAIPRDLKVVGPLFSRYSTLAEIGKKEFYYKTQKIIKKIDKDNTVYAGLYLRQFEGIYANVLPGKKYYYSVIAVDETRKYHQYCPIVEGIAYDNAPEKTKEFYSAFVQDKNKLQFEFSLPLFKDDIASHNIYIMKKDQQEQFKKYLEYIALTEAQKNLKNAGKVTDKVPAEVANPAELIYTTPTSYPYPSPTTVSLNVISNKIVDVKNKINYSIDSNAMDNYCFVFSLADYSGVETFSEIISTDKISSASLPALPQFRILDKPNDKGDYNQILFGTPIAFVTNVTFASKDHTKIILNYDYTSNEDYKIEKIYFNIYDKTNNLVGKVTEHYLDKIFEVKLPSLNLINDGLKVEIGFETSRKTLSENFYLSQSLVFNDEMKQLKPEKLTLHKKEAVLDYRYIIYKQAKTDPVQRTAKKFSAMQRVYDDNIPYEQYIYKGISDFDLSKNLLMVDPSIDVEYDKKKETTIGTIIYGEEVGNELKKYEKLISEVTGKLKTAKPEEKEGLQAELDYYTQALDIAKNNPILAKANAISNNKERIDYLASIREENKRTFSYRIVKTDGKAHFVETSFLEEDGKKEFFPVSNWFDYTTVPMMLATIIFGIFVWILIKKAQRGHDLYIRPIAGLDEIDNAIGRATEMGRPMLYVPGLSSIGDVATIAALCILGHITKKAAEYDTRIIVPVCDYIVLPLAQQIVKEAHYEAGRPDTYNSSDVFFVADSQFAYVAGVNGVMLREKTATNFYMGMFYAEALIMTETGNSTGAIQIAGSDALTQIPFFITTCDYTLIGEELYGASAYLAPEPLMVGTLKAQDYFKLLIVFCLFVGTILSSVNINFLINAFPAE